MYRSLVRGSWSNRGPPIGRPGPCCLYCSLWRDFHTHGGRAVKEGPQTDPVEIRECAVCRSELSAAISSNCNLLQPRNEQVTAIKRALE